MANYAPRAPESYATIWVPGQNRSETVSLERGKDRLHPHFQNVVIYFALAYEAFVRRQGGIPNPEPTVVWRCHAIDTSIKFGLSGVIDAAESGEFPDQILFRLVGRSPDEDGNVLGMGGLTIGLATSAFALYSERAVNWVRKNVSTNYPQWPAVANFSRVVRNAIAHGGAIAIGDAKAAPVNWRGFQLSPSDNGKTVIAEGMLGPCDILLLMLDLEHELNELGAPLELD